MKEIKRVPFFMKHRVEEKSRVQLENSLMKMMCP